MSIWDKPAQPAEVKKELTPEQEQAVKSRVIMLELLGLFPTQPSGWLPTPIASRETRDVYYLVNSSATPYLPDRAGPPVFVVGTADEIAAWIATQLKRAAVVLAELDDYKTDNTNAKDFGHTGHGAVVTYAEHPSSLKLLQIQMANYVKSTGGKDPLGLFGEKLTEVNQLLQTQAADAIVEEEDSKWLGPCCPAGHAGLAGPPGGPPVISADYGDAPHCDGSLDAQIRMVSDADKADVLKNGWAPSTSWIHRVAQEKAELDARREKLDAFIGSAAFGPLDIKAKYLLKEQSAAMHNYSGILYERLQLTGATYGEKPSDELKRRYPGYYARVLTTETSMLLREEDARFLLRILGDCHPDWVEPC